MRLLQSVLLGNVEQEKLFDVVPRDFYMVVIRCTGIETEV